MIAIGLPIESKVQGSARSVREVWFGGVRDEAVEEERVLRTCRARYESIRREIVLAQHASLGC